MVNGVPVAMAEEERFSRKKHDFGFPRLAINFVLKKSGLKPVDLDCVVFYEKPFLKFERVIKNSLATFPLTLPVFQESIKHLFLDKLWIRHLICEQLEIPSEKVLFSNHHLSHAASAFFASPWDKAAILTIDGVGEWATTTLGIGDGDMIKILKEIHFPHSLGLLYSAFTAFLGFEVNDGEYKVMGMAPYGKPKYADRVRKLIQVADDGSFELDLSYFSFYKSLNNTYSRKFLDLFGKPRDPKSRFFTRDTGWPSYFGPKPVGQDYDRIAQEQEYYAGIAASVQLVLEEVILKLCRYLHRETGLNKLCYAGGVALNSVANWKIIRQGLFKELFIQPAAGDGGGALGAALAVYNSIAGHRSEFVMRHAYYGENYNDNDIKNVLLNNGLKYEHINDEGCLLDKVSELLIAGKVIGWFHGRFEWGPRALGSRSIIADPRLAGMKDVVNTKIKFREPYRPFAPSVLSEHANEFFDIQEAANHIPARFMLYVVPVREDKRSIVPAITHVDGSARPQLVFREQSPRYYKLIENFWRKTNVPMILNTSFNLKGEPIVNTPQDAVSTFMRSGMDYLVLENFIVKK